MSVINTNITSLIGQQNLMKSQNALQTSMERLSSGLRINSAKDDAAGQAIANRMSAQITGLGQAQRNANDGISVAQTAEGALNQVNDNLQRIRELSVQAQNGTNSQEDLQSIQAEIQQRLGEIDRISEQTDFNGTKVLKQDRSLSIQVGANDGEKIDIGLQEINSSTLDLKSFNVSGPQGTPQVAGAAGTHAEDAFTNAYGESTAISASATAWNGGGEAALQSLFGVSTTTTFTLDTAQAHVDENGNWFAKVTVAGAAGTDLEKLQQNGLDNGDAWIALNPDDADLGNTTANTATFTIDETTLSTGQISSGSTADPLKALDDALSKVDTLRSDLGAVQNRFETAITNLQTNETNLQAARSRIEDADYAVEVANMTRAQILQQAGTSVLAQANQVPQSVLSLLG